MCLSTQHINVNFYISVDNLNSDCLSHTNHIATQNSSRFSVCTQPDWEQETVVTTNIFRDLCEGWEMFHGLPNSLKGP